MTTGERLNDGLSVFTVGSGPPLVSIPGLGEGTDLSVRVPRTDLVSARAIATSTGRTVHVIARPLDPPPGMSISELAGTYAGAIRERFGGPVDVFGASAGGVTGLQLALDHPDVVRKLVVAVAAARLGDDGRRLLREGVALDGRRWRAAWSGSGAMTRGPVRAVAFTAMALAGSRPRAAGELAMVEGGQTWDVTARLGEITAPTLVVGGTRDALFPKELIEATARGIPGARLVLLPGRGHLTTLFDRRGSRAIAAFLATP
ncbi:3-oxoadipate enol-lactonase [Pseudonocardia ailaonensis]|uniref:3-oxoadipate enol-lactonase n=1 Tax=Pseudonocardia ailaonensis TaxID=367279 RepID=A0ABN2MSN6_9PSEU